MTEEQAESPPNGPEATFAAELGGGGAATLVMTGRLDVVSAPEARRRLAEPPVADAPHLLVDLSGVTFVDSAGMAVLARARRDRLLRGGSVTLVRPAEEGAMRVFRLTGFDEIFTMVDRRPGP